jgi:hypothetical protein
MGVSGNAVRPPVNRCVVRWQVSTHFAEDFNFMKRRTILRFLVRLAPILMVLLICSCGRQAERENQLLRAENQSLKAENQRLQGKIDGLTEAMNLAPKADAATSKPLDSSAGVTPTADQVQTVAPSEPQQKYWLTISSNKRHNSSCRYFEKSRGRYCGPNEGIPCKLCGG